MRTGTLVASPEAWAQISQDFAGHRLDGGHVRVDGPADGCRQSKKPALPLSLHRTGNGSLRSYIPEVLLSRLDAGQGDWLAELRRTTVVFVNVARPEPRQHRCAGPASRVTAAAQRVLERYNGWLKEITMDEKGTTLVAAFGVPPFSHEDDPTRAVQAALTVQAAIRGLGLSAGVGIATGPALSGPVGNARRRDFAVLGPHVNLAARLMQASGENDAAVRRGDARPCRRPGHVGASRSLRAEGNATPDRRLSGAGRRDGAQSGRRRWSIARPSAPPARQRSPR